MCSVAVGLLGLMLNLFMKSTWVLSGKERTICFQLKACVYFGYPPVRLGNAFCCRIVCRSYGCSGHSNAFRSFLLRMRMQVETLPVLVLKSELPCTCM
jgi:hypothetical protein